MPQAPSSTDSPSRSRITHAIAPSLSDLPDGTYNAHQIGHEVSLQCRNINLTLFAEREVDKKVECVVEAKNGVVTVRDYRDSEHEEST